MTPALDEFKDNDVEIVQVMLGTNDIAQSVPTDQIVDSLNQITGRLLDNGAKVVIINRIPYSSKHNDIAVQQLNVAISELPNGQNVYLGDSQAYDYFRQNQDQLYDGIHMNQRDTTNWLSFGWMPLSGLLLSQVGLAELYQSAIIAKQR